MKRFSGQIWPISLQEKGTVCFSTIGKPDFVGARVLYRASTGGLSFDRGISCQERLNSVARY